MAKRKPTKARIKELTEMLPSNLEEKVTEGKWNVYEGQNPEKPVVIDENGRLVKGSGRWPGANDPAQTGKTYGYKNSKNYQDALKTLIPLEGDESTRGSFAWLVEQGRIAAEGSPQRIKCPECEYNGIYAFKKDATAIIKLIELVHGRAKETSEISIRSEELIAILDTRTPLNELIVHDITAEEIERRRILLLEPEAE